ncbi:MAG: hypothetical protein ACRECH_06510 [Nitrososphaerales archaeon]
MSLNKTWITSTAVICLIIVFSVGLSINYIDQASGFVPSSSLTVSKAVSSTTVTNLSCKFSNRSSSNHLSLILHGTSNVNVTALRTASLKASSCSYNYIREVFPVTGLGDFSTVNSYKLDLNFSIAPPNGSGQVHENLNITSDSGLRNLFPEINYQLYLNSQQVAAWYSNPPCYPGGDEPNIAISNCIGPNSTSIQIELPHLVETEMYSIIINSSAELVP